MSKLIVLEGIDGAGTTTQLERLAARLRGTGHEVHATREPSDGAVGKLLRQILRGDERADAATVALLFAADRLDHLAREIRPALARGAVVVSDRYVVSSLAYQSLTLPRELVADWNRLAPPADLTLFFEVPAETGAERRARRGGAMELFDALPTQLAIAAAYRREVEALRAAGQPVVILDASRSIEEVTERAWQEVERCLAR